MENKTVISIETVIGYIEDHLSGKLDLETVATAVNYSKYHLHRIFTKTVGMTMHDYVPVSYTHLEAVQDHLPLVGEAVRYQEAEGSGDVCKRTGTDIRARHRNAGTDL